MLFNNRFQAAQVLAEKLQKYKKKKDTLILAIPRGALQIGAVLSKELCLPLDVVVTKKIPAPNNPELAIGAVSYGKQYILDPEAVSYSGVSNDYIQEQVDRLDGVIEKRYRDYHCGKTSFPAVKGKTVIVVDDGIATGYTMRAAIRFLQQQKAQKIVVAVPVAARDTLKLIQQEADELICVYVPAFFGAVGQFYADFPQVEDAEAMMYLKKTKKAVN